MDNGLIGLLGLAQKGGKLQTGEESSSAAAKAHKARLLLLSSDAGERTRRHAQQLSEEGNCPLLPVPYTRVELGQAVGRGECVLLAFTDVGLAAAAAKRLSQSDPELCREVLERLEHKAEKALRRRRETQQRKKAAQAGQRKPWASTPDPKQKTGS